MLKIAVASGKGGVGKTMLASSLSIFLSKEKEIVAVDCDVDTPNLIIWLNEVGGKKITKEKFFLNFEAKVNKEKCIGCGLCQKNCVFGAIEIRNKKAFVNPFLCEGCGVCEIVCPQKAIKIKPIESGEINAKITKYGFPLVWGQLKIGKTGSGKLVWEVKKKAMEFKKEILLIDVAAGIGCPVISTLSGANISVIVSEPTVSGISDFERIVELAEFFKVKIKVIINKYDINLKKTEEIEKFCFEKKIEVIGKIPFLPEVVEALKESKIVLEFSRKISSLLEEIFEKIME